ncbi:MAG: ATP phosphoribosyltransferase [Saprospiraceae bacterium]|nr:ATP phosphoribosyltransferase [Saprospiraceae bacterium]
MKEPLRIAIQKSGRLSDQSLALLRNAGMRIANGPGTLVTHATNFPLEILYLRDDDIPQYVADGVAHAGIVGHNVVLEKAREVSQSLELGFGHCRMALAVRREAAYTGVEWLEGKKIATSYPRILDTFLAQQGVSADIEELSGSVEIAPGIGLADAVCDLVSTGSTLLINGLKEVQTVVSSQAVLIAHPGISPYHLALLQKLEFRIRAVLTAQQHKYILMNVRREAVPAVARILPGMRSPTVVALNDEGWCSLHSVVKEDAFWEVIDQLRNAGAEGILVCPIEKMII